MRASMEGGKRLRRAISLKRRRSSSFANTHTPAVDPAHRPALSHPWRRFKIGRALCLAKPFTKSSHTRRGVDVKNASAY
jgi:hypothetical protein